MYKKEKIRIIQGKKSSIPKEYFIEMLKLRHEIYRKVGFIKKNKSLTYTDSYDDDAFHIIAIDNNKVIGSLSIISNNLPLELIFKKEKEELVNRYHAKKVVEISRFVISEEYRIGKDKDKMDDYNKFVSLKLIKFAYRYILKKRINLILITVHPKFKKRYIDKYNFKCYGNQKDYPSVENNPAILMYQTRWMIYRLLISNIKAMIFMFKKN
ncbi:MAG: GNAT family N-acyltransferase [Candidatus Pacearchaeota archaeon]|jgi:N-acyl-L-homoserine lactone synthetase